MSGDDLAALLYLAGAHPDDFIRCACAARALELRGAAVTEAPTGGEVGPQSPVPPKLVASDRRGVDARRWEFVIPPSLAAELGDSTELEHHRDTFKRWEAAAARVGDLRRRHAEALEHDRAAELEFAAGAKRKLAEPTAPPLELELVGAQRAVEVLERELVAAGSRLFAASLEHVPVAARALERATPAPAVPLPAVELAQRVTRCSCRCSASYCSAVRRTNACNAAGPDCQEHLMADQLPSGRWRGRVRHPITGKQVTSAGVIGGPKTFVTRREAERAEDTARDALVDAAVRGRTVREFWTDWTTSELWARPAESTNRHNAERTAAFVAMFGERPLASIGGPDVAAYLEGGQRRGTVPALRAMFNDARSVLAGQLVGRNPFANLGLRQTRGRKDVQPPDQASTARMLAAGDELTPPSFAAYLVTAVYSAARPGELDALRWDDVDLERETIRVERQWNAKLGKITPPKHGSRRTIALTAPVRERLEQLPRDSEWLFTTVRGTHYTPSSRCFHWNRVRASVGIADVSLYVATRHYFGWYAMNVLELPPHVIALQLGHDDGGELVRRLYGHPDAAIARERTRRAFRAVAPVVALSHAASHDAGAIDRLKPSTRFLPDATKAPQVGAFVVLDLRRSPN